MTQKFLIENHSMIKNGFMNQYISIDVNNDFSLKPLGLKKDQMLIQKWSINRCTISEEVKNELP